ncbi:MAG TPA: transcription termination/antitermination protein NusA [Syntrophomonadaceae bacterium]|nr:transcription termination/antitermination protein NusA [Syntrophomonadaceae bacterium]
MNLEFIDALKDIEKEKGISSEVLLQAIEHALLTAYRKNFGSAQNARIEIARETGEIKVFSRKTAVPEAADTNLEISLEEVLKIDPEAEEGDIVEMEVTPRDFGRIAAQAAKQVVVQQIREAERGLIYEEFLSREGDIVTGIVRRQEARNIYIDLGRTEAVLLPSEQIISERYNHGDRIKTYITEVKKTTKGPQILVSRTHPGLLKRLFELEVPEIFEGIVEIKAVVREPGMRSKIAVFSRNENVDSIGACVGPKGMRVQAIVQELKGEKIDIVRWDNELKEFIANSLSPAKVVAVEIDEDEKAARVIVPDHQLSLAIGKEGQNARLAARLTGWKIDIKSESQRDLYEEQLKEQLKEQLEEQPEEPIEELTEEQLEEQPEEPTEELLTEEHSGEQPEEEQPLDGVDKSEEQGVNS